jgi:hypothetical protein
LQDVKVFTHQHLKKVVVRRQMEKASKIPMNSFRTLSRDTRNVGVPLPNPKIENTPTKEAAAWK